MYNNLLSIYPEQFYKIEFFPFSIAPTPNITGIAERKGDFNLGVIWKIENVVILKEREGDNLGHFENGEFS